jgi:hypothetical protein
VPNTYLKPQQYIELTLAELYTRSNLSNLVTPWDGDNFVGTKNDTLLYKTKPITKARDYEFRTRTRPIVFDEVYRNELPITIDQHMTVGNRWTDEERKFDLQSVRTEIATPMAEAMVERFDRKILAALQAASWAVTDLNIAAASYTGDTGALSAGMFIKQKLDRAGTPKQGRYLVLGANAFLWFITSPSVLKYDISQATRVFREGVFGRVANMEVVDGTDIIGDNEILAVHPSWAVLPNCAPENPVDKSFSVRSNFGGYSARLLADYDTDYASDRLLLNTFWGVSEIKDQYVRWTSTDIATATDGSEIGDVKIVDDKPVFSGLNARGGKGTFTPA